MNGIYGIVSCDVIDSTSLDRDALIQLREDIYSRLFSDIDTICPGFGGVSSEETPLNVALKNPGRFSGLLC